MALIVPVTTAFVPPRTPGVSGPVTPLETAQSPVKSPAPPGEHDQPPRTCAEPLPPGRCPYPRARCPYQGNAAMRARRAGAMDLMRSAIGPTNAASVAYSSMTRQAAKRSVMPQSVNRCSRPLDGFSSSCAPGCAEPAGVLSPRGGDLRAAPRSRGRSAAVRRRRTGQGRQEPSWPARRRTC
jgi:hypothetical protein